MTKYICIKELKNSVIIFNKGEFYYLRIFVGELKPVHNLIQIYDMNNKFLGGYNIKIMEYFISLSEYREKQINEILND